MEIKFEGQYMALHSFEWLNIPDLAIITGLNGSGKSQLLQLINNTYNHLSQVGLNVKRTTNENYNITINGIDFIPRGSSQWQSTGAYFSLENYKFGYKDLEMIIKMLLHYINPNTNINPTIDKNYEESHDDHYNDGFVRLKYILDSRREDIINEIVSRSGKQKNDLLPEDIMFHLPERIFSDGQDLMQQDNIDLIFFLYTYRKISLEQNNLETNILGEAPWDILNKVTESAGIPYKFTKPDEQPILAIFKNPLNRMSNYQFSVKLVDFDKNIYIGTSNLSSGEKVILSLAMLLYYYQHRDYKKGLLILDELDSHLHPSLTKQFFDVINNVVIKEYGTRVILATHSPSTIALAPTNEFFILKKSDESTDIELVDKDKAISILTSGVPSLSINYEKRKQVFVESSYDMEYYDIVYRNSKQNQQKGISLNFISSGVNGRGNCNQVAEIVNKLYGFGNSSIWGIIDWDKKNKPSGQIRVLGNGSRYSIENYIFDPVLIGYFLLRQKFITNIELGLNSEERFTEFNKFDSVKLQIIADKILASIKSKFNQPIDETTETVYYNSGKSVSLPNWFLKTYGHDLPSIYMEVFPKLQRYKDENILRREIINNTVVDFPELISKDIIDLFDDIQDN